MESGKFFESLDEMKKAAEEKAFSVGYRKVRRLEGMRFRHFGNVFLCYHDIPDQKLGALGFILSTSKKSELRFATNQEVPDLYHAYNELHANNKDAEDGK